MKNSAWTLRTIACRYALALGSLFTSHGVQATTLYVDGGCPSSGSGTALTCGASGPFKTLSEGISAMNAGDTLNIRGPHGVFDGVYTEYVGVWGTTSDAYAGDSLACTAAAPCVVQGCPANACGADETPTISGLVRRTDWTETSSGSGVWYRIMEQRSEPLPTYHFTDDFGPGQILQGDAKAHLQYDTSTSPTEGHFNYDSATHRVYVNPTGTGNPNVDTKLWVPDHKALLVAIANPNVCPTASQTCKGVNYVTFRRLAFEGSRHTGIEVNTGTSEVGAGTAGWNLTFDNVTIRHVPSYGMVGSNFKNLTVSNTTVEYVGRGVQLTDETPSTVINSWGVRLFHLDGAQFSNLTVQHLGGARLNGQGCPWCDAPWNDQTSNATGGFGNAIDIKQSRNVTVNNYACSDTSFLCMQNDVTHDADYVGLRFRTCRVGMLVREFTPDAGVSSVCPCTRNYNVSIHESTIDNCGFNDTGAITVTPMSALNAADFGMKIYNNFVTRSAYAAIAVNTADRVSILNNSIWGGRSPLGYTGFGWNTPNDGIKLLNTVSNLDVRNNIIKDVEGDALEVHANSAGGTFDYDDILNTTTSCAQDSSPGTVRWGVTGYDGNFNVSRGGTCYTSLASFRGAQPAKEPHGISLNPSFANTAAASPDLHVQAGSPMVDAGVSLSSVFTIDIDRQARPQGAAWDIGGDEYGGAEAIPSAPTLLEAVPLAP